MKIYTKKWLIIIGYKEFIEYWYNEENDRSPTRLYKIFLLPIYWFTPSP